MKFGSVCSGIEAASVAWLPLGWQCAFVSEIEPFPCAVLNHYYTEVPNRGDMTKFKEWPDAAIDVLVGGTPCQSFSVAGLRKGLDDPRGNLMLTYLAIAEKYRPAWLVWENVPGVLSVDGGRAFGALLGGLAKLGYGFAYRILDAQYFGVPQRRRRVFVVGCLGDWRAAAAVLFERHSLQGNPAPRREAGQRIAGTTGPSTSSGRSTGSNPIIDNLITPAHSLRAQAQASHRADSDNYVPVVAQNQRDELRTMDVAGALAGEPGMKQQTYLHQAMQVRRLTPRECERLQGFPDNYTLVPYRGKPAADGPRYKALGNSMAVPVMRWLGERLSASPDAPGGR